MRCSSCETQDDTVYVSAFRGDTIELNVTFYDSAMEPLDLTGWLWLGQVRDGAGDAVADWQVTEGETLGSLVLTLSPDDTGDLLGDYEWDLQATDVDANVKTFLAGELRIKEDVSR